MRISQVCKGHRILSSDDAPACDVRQRAAEILATLASADHLQFPGQFEPRQPPRNQRHRPNFHHPKGTEGPGEALPSQTLPLLAPGLTPLSAGCRGGGVGSEVGAGAKKGVAVMWTRSGGSPFGPAAGRRPQQARHMSAPDQKPGRRKSSRLHPAGCPPVTPEAQQPVSERGGGGHRGCRTAPARCSDRNRRGR